MLSVRKVLTLVNRKNTAALLNSQSSNPQERITIESSYNGSEKNNQLVSQTFHNVNVEWINIALCEGIKMFCSLVKRKCYLAKRKTVL